MPKSNFAKTMQDQLLSMGMELVQSIPGDQATANKLLLKNLEMLKLLIASLDVGIDWDTYEIWIKPGSGVRTLIAEVQPGDIVVIKATNYDVDNAQVVFYAQSQGVRPSKLEGLEFPPIVINAGVNDAIPFDEGGAPLTAFIAPGPYATGAALAAAAAAALTAAGNPLITYTVAFGEGTRVFTLSSDKAVAGSLFNLRFGTGVATNAAAELGFTRTDQLDPNPVGPGNATSFSGIPVVKTIADGDKLLVGYPLFAGDTETVVCEDSLYGTLEDGSTLPCPVTVRRSRIVVRNRGGGSGAGGF